ncbi:ABC transporter substrate-binding protein [Aliarcobacter butzleri]|uniref:ABC transporter substrate-binding protein n=1 Tax=Aliarcobacter butzleri TaxID=28197 RepID=UPI0011630103|nr:ABC transporter substrate-binding protein [Aliarcobacter butzleri]QDM01661.1 transporter substrate-binding domain-containing protein [Aliarcobacter butzleri]
MKKITLFIILLIFITSFSHAKELKKIKLQLSWFNQFQFAGYYMAKEKGFYEEVGFDVEIVPFNFDIDIPKEVSDGKIDFAIGRETLILEKAKGRNVVALYALFQASPLILISTKDSKINSIKDFENKKIMTTLDDSSEVSLRAMIISNNVNISTLTFQNHTHNINDLVNKKTDVISAYTSKSPYFLEKEGIEYNVFAPKDYGFDMYSDFLYTNENLVNNDLDTVLLFKAASLKGWEYAYSNIEESAELIHKKYNTQNLSKNELIFEGRELRKLSYFNTVNLGEIKEDKLQRISDIYNLMGLLKGPVDLKKFIFNLNYIRSLTLTQEEKDYLENKDSITMCVVPNYMPYSDIKGDKFVGFIADYMSIIENRIKKPITLVPTSTWTQSLDFAINKKCDILTGASWSENREKYFKFTKPYLNVPVVLLTRSNVPLINNLDLIGKKKIAVVENYVIYEELKKKYKNIEFITVKDSDEGISKVLNGEIFGFIDTLSTNWYKIQTEYLEKISINTKLDLNMDFCIAVNNEEKILYDIFQKAVVSMDDIVKNEILNKWIFTEYEKGFNYYVFVQVFIGILLVFIAILYRQKLLKKVNTSLKNLVDEKTKELKDINNELEDRIKKEIEENLKKDRLLSQQQKMVSMGQMIENIAHQWRQPLSLITTSASGIKIKKELDVLDDKYLYDTLDFILNTSAYLSDTIDDFRYFFKPQKDKEIFYLKNCCKRTIDLIKPNFIENNITIIENIEDLKINGYESELIQVLINILNNAKDALLLTKYDRFIFIDVIKDNKKALIKIKDNAGGIDANIIAKVFEPYFTTKHKHFGTGIGLYMCQEIISKHMDGEIDISNVKFDYKDKQYDGTLVEITLNIEE